MLGCFGTNETLEKRQLMRTKWKLASVYLRRIVYTFGSSTGCTKGTAWDLSGINNMEKIRPKVLIITMFQEGEPGLPDGKGEASFWVQRRSLVNSVPVPGVTDGLYLAKNYELGAIVTGVGKANAATSVLCLGLHPEIDLSDAYIIVCGIAGANPNRVSIGSPVWCEAVVDGDLASFVSMTELEQQRVYPFFPMGTTGAEDESPYAAGTEIYTLDKALVDQAFSLTRESPLLDDARSRAYRATYQEKPATRAPFVSRGGFLSSDTFLHGHLTGKWSQEWVRQWAGNAIPYVLGNQEDSGTLTALKALSDMGHVQWNRVLLLRAGSNYDRPAPGVSALDSLREAIYDGVPVAMDIALENIYRVANRFVDHVLG